MNNEICVFERDYFFDQLIHKLQPKLQKKGNILKVVTDYDFPSQIGGNQNNLMKVIHSLALCLSDMASNSVIKISSIIKRNYNEYIEIEFKLSTSIDAAQRTKYLSDANHFDEAPLNKVRTVLFALNSSLSSDIYDDKVVYKFILTLEQPKSTFNENITVFAGKKALIVEDNQVNALVFASFMEEWGIDSEIATNGREAMGKLESHDFDIILMDIHMPILNGIEATKKIRKSNSHKVIIGLTASTEKEEHDLIKKAGAFECLVKPVSSSSLLRCLHKHLTKENTI